MTDLEMVKLCALAIGLTPDVPSQIPDQPHWYCRDKNETKLIYDPLFDDAQCMALVKKFAIEITIGADGKWEGSGMYGKAQSITIPHDDLNHAVVGCVAVMVEP